MDFNPPGSSVPGFPRQEYWTELPFPSSGNLPNPGVKPVLAGGFFTTEPPEKPEFTEYILYPQYYIRVEGVYCHMIQSLPYITDQPRRRKGKIC